MVTSLLVEKLVGQMEQCVLPCFALTSWILDSSCTHQLAYSLPVKMSVFGGTYCPYWCITFIACNGGCGGKLNFSTQMLELSYHGESLNTVESRDHEGCGQKFHVPS